ncbi:MAG TPA: hypothetical protein VNU94_02450 [Acidobacteriaceae bacterium]|nr:hypothetical protein [Acidobacteriaceae bacterium]
MSQGIITAVIAAGISLLGLIISKEAKISEFRKEWIESLRTDISCFLMHALYMKGVADSNDTDKVAKLENSNLEINRLVANVTLRLNPKEQPHQEIMEALGGVRDAVITGKPFEVVTDKATLVTNKTQIVLRQEWQRVKKGERVYQWTVRSTLAAFALLVIVLILKSL